MTWSDSRTVCILVPSGKTMAALALQNKMRFGPSSSRTSLGK